MHAAQLGVPTAWVSALGDDALGERVRDEVAGRGVDTRWVSLDPDAPPASTSRTPATGCCTTGAARRPRGWRPRRADVPLEDAEVVHISGITPALSASCAALIDTVIDRVAAGPGTLAFDVNHRAALWAPAPPRPRCCRWPAGPTWCSSASTRPSACGAPRPPTRCGRCCPSRRRSSSRTATSARPSTAGGGRRHRSSCRDPHRSGRGSRRRRRVRGRVPRRPAAGGGRHGPAAGRPPARTPGAAVDERLRRRQRLKGRSRS